MRVLGGRPGRRAALKVGRLGTLVLIALLAGASDTTGQLAGQCSDATLRPWTSIEGTHTLPQDPPPVAAGCRSLAQEEPGWEQVRVSLRTRTTRAGVGRPARPTIRAGKRRPRPGARAIRARPVRADARGAYRVGGLGSGFEPNGPWAGEERVLVYLTPDSLAYRIDVHYPEGSDTEELAQTLIAEFGPGEPDSPWLTWVNHSTRSLFQRSGRPRLILEDTTMGPR